MIGQISASLIGTMAFSVLFGVPKRYCLMCGAIGMVGWVVYLLLEPFVNNTFAIVAATVLVACLSRLSAVAWKCPTTIFMITGLFPLIPGGGIYWTTYYLMVGEQNMAVHTGYGALKSAVAIVLGVVLVDIIPQSFFRKIGSPIAAFLEKRESARKAEKQKIEEAGSD
ncbi:MAG: threonine/serine exporter family protein [Lachnospiraceae bacterium]|jgi:uncharacterized membrane protein YjjB (DUF3815 family)